MKQISRWASQHRYLAISLLVGCEVVNGHIGVLLGANCLESWPRGVITVLLLLLSGGAIGIRQWGTPRFGRLTYPAQRRLLLGAFGLNFLLFVALGGLWGAMAANPTPQHTALASRTAVTRTDTIPPAPPGKPVVQTPAPTSKPTSDSGKRVAYVLLGLVGIGLGIFSMGLACSISCAGHGFAAVLTLLFGFGFMAGSVYLLARLREHPIQPLRELPQPARRHILGRFWKASLLLIGIFGSILLLTAIF